MSQEQERSHSAVGKALDLWRLRAVVGLEVIVDLGLVASAVVSGKAFLVPGAVGRLLIMGALGATALAGRPWARWCFAAQLVASAIAAFIVGLWSFTGGPHLVVRPAILAVGTVYGLGVLLTIPSARDRTAG